MTTDPQPAPTQGEAPSAQPVLENTPQVPPQQAAPPQQPAPPQQAAPPPDPAAPSAAAPHPLPQHRIKRTRTGGIWGAGGFFAVILLLLLIFILQNGPNVEIAYMGLHGHPPPR